MLSCVGPGGGLSAQGVHLWVGYQLGGAERGKEAPGGEVPGEGLETSGR